VKIENNNDKKESIVIGGGCFWCIEAVFSRVKGVVSAISGYAGGSVANPTYEQVCGGKTGHAEVTEISFDTEAISLESILHIFFTVHDPTTMDRQGNDVGTQYRSAIFYANEEQKLVAEKIIREISDQLIYDNPIVTELKPLDTFYPAEEYHQHYFKKNPEAAYCQIVIAPKVAKFRSKYSDLYI
jgi:peptide-methionine (S)-S-oxide reductase